MKTDEEIVKGLESCNGRYPCDECPYRKTPKGKDCKTERNIDAIALIQQLQADNAEKDKRIQQLERSLSFASDLADGLKAATVKQEQELYVSEERNRQLEAQNAELLTKVEQLQAERDAALENIRGDCVYCLHLCEDMVAPSCFDCANKGYYRWEWRGVQKEVEHP